MILTENLNDALVEALNAIYPIRDGLRESLMETYSDELLNKLIALNKIIDNAEVIINKGKDVKKFYAEEYPEYVDENNEINDRGVRRISILKKKWKTLGYLKKDS